MSICHRNNYYVILLNVFLSTPKAQKSCKPYFPWLLLRNCSSADISEEPQHYIMQFTNSLPTFPQWAIIYKKKCLTRRERLWEWKYSEYENNNQWWKFDLFLNELGFQTRKLKNTIHPETFRLQFKKNLLRFIIIQPPCVPPCMCWVEINNLNIQISTKRSSPFLLLPGTEGWKELISWEAIGMVLWMCL